MRFNLKFFMIIGILVGMTGFTTGCATQGQRPAFDSYDLNPGIHSGEYEQKVDNFLIILDASSSMAGSYQGKQKLAYAREMLTLMNQTIPEINLLGGLRVYGNTPSGEPTELIYGFSDYTMARTLEDALYEVMTPAGRSSMGAAIHKSIDDLNNLRGNSAVIIVSDGYATGDPVSAADAVKSALGEKVCIYPVCVGDDPDGYNRMEAVALAGGCGFTEQGTGISDPEKMAQFVRKVFLTGGTASVPVPVPEAVETVEKEESVVPIQTEPAAAGDSDGDGVADAEDACPGTPLGVRVDHRGCWLIAQILFDYDETAIKAEYYATLDEVASAMQANPDLSVEIQGHTDNMGSSDYNMALSFRRAEAVKAYLLDRGVSESRLASIGFGLSQPTAPNETKEGRAQNRRVELAPMTFR